MLSFDSSIVSSSISTEEEPPSRPIDEGTGQPVEGMIIRHGSEHVDLKGYWKDLKPDSVPGGTQRLGRKKTRNPHS